MGSTKAAARRILSRLRRGWISLRTPSPSHVLPKFQNNPKDFEIMPPWTIRHPERISIGDGVKLGPHCLIGTCIYYPLGWMISDKYPMERQRFEPTLRIGNQVIATGNLQAVAYQSVVIEDDVLLAWNVLISDATHGFSRVDIPYRYQPMSKISPIVVGRGSWIGQNAVIMPGVKIGEMCVVGANSVVTRSLPAYCVAAGAPAKVIRKWNDATQSWERVA